MEPRRARVAQTGLEEHAREDQEAERDRRRRYRHASPHAPAGDEEPGESRTTRPATAAAERTAPTSQCRSAARTSGPRMPWGASGPVLKGHGSAPSDGTLRQTRTASTAARETTPRCARCCLAARSVSLRAALGRAQHRTRGASCIGFLGCETPERRARAPSAPVRRPSLAHGTVPRPPRTEPERCVCSLDVEGRSMAEDPPHAPDRPRGRGHVRARRSSGIAAPGDGAGTASGVRLQPLWPARQRDQQQHLQPEPAPHAGLRFRARSGRSRRSAPRCVSQPVRDLDSGQLYASGFNWYGALGNATGNSTSNPTPTPTLVTLARARSGQSHRRPEASVTASR